MAASEYATAYTLAKTENAGITKETVLLRLQCSALIAERSKTETEAAAKCLRQMIANHLADYVTYYNLACMESRMGHWDEALRDFATYVATGGRVQDKRSSVKKDPDFAGFILKSPKARDFQTLLVQLGDW